MYNIYVRCVCTTYTYYKLMDSASYTALPLANSDNITERENNIRAYENEREKNMFCVIR